MVMNKGLQDYNARKLAGEDADYLDSQELDSSLTFSENVENLRAQGKLPKSEERKADEEYFKQKLAEADEARKKNEEVRASLERQRERPHVVSVRNTRPRVIATRQQTAEEIVNEVPGVEYENYAASRAQEKAREGMDLEWKKLEVSKAKQEDELRRYELAKQKKELERRETEIKLMKAQGRLDEERVIHQVQQSQPGKAIRMGALALSTFKKSTGGVLGFLNPNPAPSRVGIAQPTQLANPAPVKERVEDRIARNFGGMGANIVSPFGVGAGVVSPADFEGGTRRLLGSGPGAIGRLPAAPSWLKKK